MSKQTTAAILLLHASCTILQRSCSACRQKLAGVQRLRRGERDGAAAALPDAVAERRRLLAARRALQGGGAGSGSDPGSDGGDSSGSGSEVEDVLAVDWRAKR